MSRLHNKNISLIDEVDTIIIEQETLSDGRIKSAGEYKISDTIVDDRKIARITPTYEDTQQSRNLIIMDDKDKLLLEGVYFKRKCMRNALNIYSPAGFLLGTVKESFSSSRYLKWSADYEILAANQKVLFHARQEKNANDYSIKITQKTDNELISKVTKSPSPTGQIWYTITYLRHIPALQKILVLFEVLSSCQQESSSFVSKISKLNDGRIQSSGEYQISNSMIEGKEITRLTPEYDDHHQDDNLVIRNNAGQILLDNTFIKRKCFKQGLNTYSPAGFFLGKLRKKYFKCKTEYEILTANQDVFFLLEIHKQASEFSIKVNTVNGEQMIAEVSSSPLDDEKLRFTLTYFENTSILQKSLILCAALFCCEQEYNALKFKYDICSNIENALCCPFYKQDKMKFLKLFLLFPLLLVLYVLPLLFGLVEIVITFGLCFLDNKPGDCIEMLTWPCGLCDIQLELIRCSCCFCI